MASSCRNTLVDDPGIQINSTKPFRHEVDAIYSSLLSKLDNPRGRWSEEFVYDKIHFPQYPSI